MRLTPLDIREQQFRRVMRGLDPEEVEAFLVSVATEFEVLVSSNNDLRQRVVELEEKIQEYRSMEKALRDTLLTAEKVMGDAKESAQREATLIIREAEVAAQRTKGRLQQELAQLQHEISEMRRIKDAYLTRVRWLLRAHLEMVDGHAQEFAELDQGLGIAPISPGPAAALPPGPSGPAPAPPAALPPAAPPGVAAGYVPAPRSDWMSADPRSRPQTPPGSAAAGPSGYAGLPATFAPATVAPPASAVPGLMDWPAVPGSAPVQPTDDLADALRPVGPDGGYGAPPTYPSPQFPGYAGPGGAGAGAGEPRTPAEEIALAARRAERLAAEARAALDRHAGTAPAPAAWSADRGREGMDPRP